MTSQLIFQIGLLLLYLQDVLSLVAYNEYDDDGCYTLTRSNRFSCIMKKRPKCKRWYENKTRIKNCGVKCCKPKDGYQCRRVHTDKATCALTNRAFCSKGYDYFEDTYKRKCSAKCCRYEFYDQKVCYDIKYGGFRCAFKRPYCHSVSEEVDRPDTCTVRCCGYIRGNGPEISCEGLESNRSKGCRFKYQKREPCPSEDYYLTGTWCSRQCCRLKPVEGEATESLETDASGESTTEAAPLRNLTNSEMTSLFELIN